MNNSYRILDDLMLVPEEASFALLIRHADRGSLPDGEVGESCLLTEQGLRDAREMGRQMAGRGIDRACSSFVPRCIQTAKEILQGAGAGQMEVEVRKKLGDPGLYVSNPIAAAMSFRKYGNAGVIERFVADGGLDGFKPLKWGCSQFMTDIVDDLAKPGARNLYISHDMILIPLISHFTGERFSSERWLDCLDGIVFARTEGRLMAIRNGKVYLITI